MQRSQLILSLRQLDAAARRRWRELVFSDFWNKNKTLRELCALVLEAAPDFSDAALHKEAVYARLFGLEEPCNELKINNLVSDLYHLLLDSLALDEWKERPGRRHDALVEALLKREMTEAADRALRRWTQQEAAARSRSADDYYGSFRRLSHLDALSLTRARRAYGDHLQPKQNALDAFYHIEKLKIACDMRSRSHVVKGAYDMPFLDEVLSHCRNPHWEGAGLPAIRIYLGVYELLGSPAEEGALEALRLQLGEAGGVFGQEEKYTLYSYLLNYCVKQINSGATRYYRPVFDLYRDMLGQGALLRHGRLSQWAYANIATTGIRLKEYDWTGDFIQQYRDALPEEGRHTAYTYNLANLRFEQKRYDEALLLLQGVVFTDAFYHLAAKLMQLKIYYEKGEAEPLLSLLEATRIYLKRNRQLSEYQQASNQQFLRLLQRVFALKEDRRRIDARNWQRRRQALLSRIQSSQPLANKDWLNEAFAALEWPKTTADYPQKPDL